MSKLYAAPLSFELNASRWLIGFFSFFYLSTLSVTWLLPLSNFYRIPLHIVIISLLVYHVQQQARRVLAKSIVRLTWKKDGDWWLCTHNHHQYVGHLLKSSFFHPYVVILNFKLTGYWLTQSVIIAPDALPGAAFRALRIRLRLEGARQSV